MDKTYQIIKKNIYECVTSPIIISDTKFHHELNITRLPNVIKHGGLLSNRLRAQIVEKRELTEKEIYALSDEHYVNGMDYISLSSMEEDFDKLYRDERIYSTYDTILPDIIISSRVKASRTTTNYYNEYLVANEIPIELFNAINFRILKILNFKFSDSDKYTTEFKIELMKKKYEVLREVALLLKEYNLNIPIREVSNVICPEQENTNALTLDIDKVIKLPKL